MMTTSKLEAILAESREDYRAICGAYRLALGALNSAYNATVDGKPSETAKTLRIALGDMADAIVATLVNMTGDWDARISPRVRAWAQTVEKAADREAGQRMYLYSDIHPAHLNQIATEMM